MIPLLVFLYMLFPQTQPLSINSRVIGGSESYVGQFPFAVAIYVQTADSRFFCGGALLNHDWVLTAGHCVNNAELFTLQLGSNTLESPDPNRLIVSSTEYILHPDFNAETIENDLGVIKLRGSVSYTSYIQPINLPSINLLNDTLVTVVGWGQVNDYQAGLSDTLQYTSAYVLSNVQCRLYYGNAITDNMACVRGNYNEGTCNGDNGSPLVEYLSRRYWIVGVASFISGNGCESTDPSGYTRTFPYTDWITNTTYFS